MEQIKIFNSQENLEIKDILSTICKNVFSLPVDLIINYEINLVLTSCLASINNNFIYIKYSSSKDFIFKDYSIKWILQDTDISILPIQNGHIEALNLYFSVFKVDNFLKLKEETENLDLKIILKKLNFFHSLDIPKNEKIETQEFFFKKKFNFKRYVNFFNTNLNYFIALTNCYGELHEQINQLYNKIAFSGNNILLHGDLNEKNILSIDKDFLFINFENSFYGESIIDICLLFINLKFSKKIFLSYFQNLNIDAINFYSQVYDLCFLKKALDFISNIVFSFSCKNYNQSVENNLCLSFFENIDEIKTIKKILLNLINRSNV